MAWVTQKFELDGMTVRLEKEKVLLGNQGCEIAVWEPKTSESAHGMALMLRRAARRLEEIGTGLPK